MVNWNGISKSVKFIVIDSDGTEYHLKKEPIFTRPKGCKDERWCFNKSSIFAWFNYKHADENGMHVDYKESLLVRDC